MHSLILTERTSWMEPMPWLLRDKTPWVLPGEVVNITVLMSGFVNVVDMPKKNEGEDRRILSAIFYIPCGGTGKHWRSEPCHRCYVKPSWGWILWRASLPPGLYPPLSPWVSAPPEGPPENLFAQLLLTSHSESVSPPPALPRSSDGL